MIENMLLSFRSDLPNEIIGSAKTSLTSFTSAFDYVITERNWLTFTGFALWIPVSIRTDQFEEAAVADIALDSHLFAIAVCVLQITCVEIWVVQAAAQKAFESAVCGTNGT